MTRAEMAREAMIQRGETEKQTDARHFRKSQVAFSGRNTRNNNLPRQPIRQDSYDFTERDEKLVNAVKSDLRRAGITVENGKDYRYDGGRTTGADRARQRMIDRMTSGGVER